MTSTRIAKRVALALTLLSASIPALAQTGAYPTRPIRLIVPVTPGGTTDVVGRIVAAGLSEALGQTMVVDNRAGAGGVIGSDIVAKASPDGHTLLFAYASHTSMPGLYPKLPFDSVKDFTPISQVSITPLVIVINPALPIGSVKELLAAAKAKPGGFLVGLATAGSAGHLAFELFKSLTGAAITPVVYRGGGPAQIAVMSGEVQLVFASTGASLPYIKNGRVKVIATTSPKRLPYLPEVPTLVEAGLKDFSVMPWQGMLGPANLPRPIVDRLHGEIVKLLRSREFTDKIVATGSDPVGSTPEEFGSEIRREIELFGKIIRAAGIKGG